MNMRSRFALAVLGVIGAALSLSAAAAPGDIPATLRKAGQLNVGVKCDSPPSAFLDKQGKPAGIDVDFSHYIAKNAFGDPNKVAFTCVTSATRMQMLTSGKVDLLIATMSPTEERMRMVDFTNSTNWGASGVLVPKSKLDSYKTLDDFKGKTLLSIKGTWQAQYVREHYPDIRLVLLDNMSAAVLALEQGRADGFTQDVKALLPASAKDPDLSLSHVRFQISWGAPAVRRGDDEFRIYMNGLIDQARKDGTFESAVRKYTSGPLQQLVIDGYLKPAADGSSPINTVLR